MRRIAMLTLLSLCLLSFAAHADDGAKTDRPVFIRSGKERSAGPRFGVDLVAPVLVVAGAVIGLSTGIEPVG